MITKKWNGEEEKELETNNGTCEKCSNLLLDFWLVKLSINPFSNPFSTSTYRTHAVRDELTFVSNSVIALVLFLLR